MADGMNFDKYIDNPSGGSSVVTNRNMYKEMYKQKFNTVLVREQGKINYFVYKSKDNTDSYFIHMKIPSEVISNFYYDVVIRLYTTENSKKASSVLRNYAVQFYSNDPAFVYTFVHAFAKNKIFIEDLSPKMSKVALDNRAKIKNPKDNVWYVKSLFFAYLTMEKYNLFNRTVLDREQNPYDKKLLLSKIVHADEKIQARQLAQEKLQKEKTNTAKSKKSHAKIDVEPKSHAKVSTVRHSKNTKNTSTVSSVKSAKISNKIKKS